MSGSDDASTSCVTFVTMYMNIYPKGSMGKRDMVWRFEQFAKIAETGIQLCVYVDESSVELLDQFITLYPNVRRMRVYKNVADTWVNSMWRPYGNMHANAPHQGLPNQRNTSKDTYEYIALMHTKMECMTHAMKHNPWSSTHFSWVDFNIAHIFQNTPACQAQLRALSSNTWKSARPFLAIPGCWPALPVPMDAATMKAITNTIHWRFCGGFFLGDMQSVAKFCTLYHRYLPDFFAEYNRMTWEVNFWAWLEHKVADWTPDWYAADHNDSMLNVPLEWWSMCLADDVSSYTSHPHVCPDLGNDFHPMSASVVPCTNNHNDDDHEDGYWVNTRYVNYQMTENGSYVFHHPDRKIVTRNMCSRLNADMVPQEFFEMANPDDLTSRQCAIEGVEDVRLYPNDATNTDIYYMGSTVNYAAEGRTRIVRGIYNVGARRLTHNELLEPPTDTVCEKNWTPLSFPNSQLGNNIVYEWSRVTVGHVGAGGKLVPTVSTKATTSPWLSKFRGSTYFRASRAHPDHLIGLVHFSEHEFPRNYYHVLMLLDKKTLRPWKHSRPFSFCHRTCIEFCIGMIETGGKYHFWISQHDRDPLRVSVSVEDIPFFISVA